LSFLSNRALYTVACLWYMPRIQMFKSNANNRDGSAIARIFYLVVRMVSIRAIISLNDWPRIKQNSPSTFRLSLLRVSF
jgi:uncharacterized protein involved in response to NO